MNASPQASQSDRLAALRALAEVEPGSQWDATLQPMTAAVADLLRAQRVSVQALDAPQEDGKGGAKGAMRLHLVAVHGSLPQAAWQETPSLSNHIAGQVLRQNRAIRVADIDHSPWKALARHPGEGGGFMACPIHIAGGTIGVLNVSGEIGRARFSAADFQYLQTAAAIIGRALHIARLNRLLESRLAQMALTLDGVQDACAVVSLTTQEPDKVAAMLARAFYREMRHCGFGPNQIIRAASEIISELTGNLDRHRQRLERPSAKSERG